MIRVAAALALAGAFALPARAEIEITPVTSPGGIEAWLYEDESIPILTIEASFLGGAALDPPGREGATSLMAALLEEGAGNLDATGFAVAREDLAAQFGFAARRDELSVSATMLAENRDASVELLRLALVEPRFEAAALERVRGQLLASIRSAETDARSLAGDAFYAQAFPGHPYARPVDGTLASMAALGAPDLRAAHEAALTRDRLRLAVVGAITPE
ncbi:MAG: insulinase family protein, partial [Rhodobacteraceae bacterium]|nr:insulinase family protein [Paracoccaceae bacterium]